MKPPQPLLRDSLETWLRGQGHATKISVDDNGRDARIAFRSRGLQYLIITDDESPDFLCMRLIMLLDADAAHATLADAALATLANAAQAVQSAKPVVKIRYSASDVAFHVEQFLAPGQLDAIFWRCVQIMHDASDAFFAELQAATPASAAHAFIDEITRELHLS